MVEKGLKEQAGEPTEELHRYVMVGEAHGRERSRDPCLQYMSEAQVTQTLCGTVGSRQVSLMLR